MKSNKFSFLNFFKKYYKYLFLIIGIVGIAVMIIQSDPQNVEWDMFLSTDLLFLLLVCFATWIVIYIIHTLSYKIILGEESKKIDFAHMMKICVTGFALNNVTPAGLVGGEPYRIMELKKYCSTEKSASSTLTFTLFYTLGHLMLWVSGVVAYIIYGLPGSTIVDILLLASGIFCLAAVFCIIFVKTNVVYPVMRFLTKLPLIGKKLAPLVERKKDSYIEIDQNIMAFRKEGWRFYAVMFLQFASRLLEAFEYFVIIQYFAHEFLDINYFDGLLVMSTCSLIGNLLFIIPMQVGTREGGMAIALDFLYPEYLSQIAVPVGIVYRFREIVCTLIGIIMVAATRRNKRAIAEVEDSKNASQEEDNK